MRVQIWTPAPSDPTTTKNAYPVTVQIWVPAPSDATTIQITTAAPRDAPPNFLSLALLARSSQ
jgi:hypothetical protein